MWKKRQQEVPDSKEYFDAMYDELMYRKEQRDAFYNDLQQCNKIVFVNSTVPATTYYFLLTKFYPILTYCTLNSPHALYYSVDWTYVSRVSIEFIDLATEISDYLRPLYLENYKTATPLRYQTSPRFWINLCEAPQSSWTVEDLFKACYQGLAYQTKHAKRYGTQYAQQVGGPGAWSESMWPEMVGIRTAYINNVGVFIPDFTDIDLNLSHSLGSQMLALQFIRPPSSEAEQQLYDLRTFQAFMEFIFSGSANRIPTGTSESTTTFYNESGVEVNKPGGNPTYGGAGAGAAQGIINTYRFGMQMGEREYQQIRVAYPRVRAFTRQNPGTQYTYQGYLANITAAANGAQRQSRYNSATGKRYEWYKIFNKYLLVLDGPDYAKFMQKLSTYLTAMNITADTDPEQLPTFQGGDWFSNQPNTGGGGGGL